MTEANPDNNITDATEHADATPTMTPAVVLAILWALLPAAGGFILLGNIGAVRDWLDTHGTMGVVIFTLGFAMTAGIGILPTYAQAVLAGWVFGMAQGGAAALVGFTGAAIVGYAVARLVARDRAQQYIAANERYTAVRNALVGRGFWPTLGVVSLLRVPPNSPFAVTNLVLAGTGTALLPFAIATLIGMTPRTLIAVGFAASARATGARDIQEFIKDGPGTLVFVLGIVALIIVLAILGSIANRAIKRVVEA